MEGFIVIDTALEKPLPLPTVVISGHRSHPGVTNVVLNHDRAAHLALEHLVQLGHERIAFIKGQPYSSDSETRWKAIERAAESLGLAIEEELVVQLEIDTFSPYVGYPVVRRLLQRTRDFTALFAYNDLSALTTVRQPLDKMGALAGEILLQRIHGGADPVEVMVDPELIIRESTAPARSRIGPAKLESFVET